jgi:hypothetical protein
LLGPTGAKRACGPGGDVGDVEEPLLGMTSAGSSCRDQRYVPLTARRIPSVGIRDSLFRRLSDSLNRLGAVISRPAADGEAKGWSRTGSRGPGWRLLRPPRHRPRSPASRRPTPSPRLPRHPPTPRRVTPGGFTFQDEAGGSSPPRLTIPPLDQRKRQSALPESAEAGVYRIKNSYLVTVPRHGCVAPGLRIGP